MKIRGYFDQELQQLQDDLIVLGSMVSEALQDAVAALRERRVDKAERIIAYDRVLNERRFAIEDRCLTLLATQQPTAGDLRLIAAVLEISMELERMGDYAKGIGRITVMLGPECTIRIPPEIQQMTDFGMDMLRRALDAFINHDLSAARSIPLEDDAVDRLYNQVNRELITRVMAHPSRSDQLNYVSWAAHNLERFSDRVTNICERIIYTITGEFREFDAHEPEASGVN
jgi:phosphate transport system protein